MTTTQAYHIVEQFFDSPYQVWDYWHVPGMYTYLKTAPSRILSSHLLHLFMGQLRSYALEHLGLTTVTEPYLSLYVNGCGQGLHNDSTNGSFAYVYSLTNWDSRIFTGGETLLWADTTYWESGRFKQGGAGTSFYQLIPARFNQLVLFDDRFIHAVQPMSGTMNPKEGRLVLHGHIQAGDTQVDGTLSLREVRPLLSDYEQATSSVFRSLTSLAHGYVSFRLDVSPDGRVAEARVVGNRLLDGQGREHHPEIEQLVQRLRNELGEMRFPSTTGRTTITWPITCSS